MIWSLPYDVEIDGERCPIRDKCDYRVVLDTIEALNDEELTEEERFQCALIIFYGESLQKIRNYEDALQKMLEVINCGEKQDASDNDKPKLMDWAYDFPQLAPPISRVLGYEVRMPDKYTHWWTFVGGYSEIGECTFSTIVSIRSKRAKGKKLDGWETDFYKANRKLVDLPHKMTKEEQEFLEDSEW